MLPRQRAPIPLHSENASRSAPHERDTSNISAPTGAGISFFSAGISRRVIANAGIKCGANSHFVMAGLVLAIHDLLAERSKTWMPGSSPGMTS